MDLIADSRNAAVIDPQMSPSLQPSGAQDRQNHGHRPGAYELKYLVPIEAAENLLHQVSKSMSWDAHGRESSTDGLIGFGYWIESLYTDTPTWNVYHRTPGFGQRKYRIRRYGNSDSVYLERKRKHQGLVTKRRTQLPLDECVRLGQEVLPETLNEHEWFHYRLHRRSLNPVAHVRYFRRALMGAGPFGTLRITVDTQLTSTVAHGFDWPSDDDNAPRTEASLMEDQAVVEFKFSVAIPSQFRTWIDDFGLSRTPCSKYRTAVERLQLIPQGAERMRDAV